MVMLRAEKYFFRGEVAKQEYAMSVIHEAEFRASK